MADDLGGPVVPDVGSNQYPPIRISRRRCGAAWTWNGILSAAKPAGSPSETMASALVFRKVRAASSGGHSTTWRATPSRSIRATAARKLITYHQQDRAAAEFAHAATETGAPAHIYQVDAAASAMEKACPGRAVSM
jgi:hypothetical protein